MHNIITLTSRFGKCAECKKEKFLYNKCEECNKLLCKECASYFLFKDEDMTYYTPEIAKCLCKKCQVKPKYVRQRRPRKYQRTRQRSM